jgi:hypothetical protein
MTLNAATDKYVVIETGDGFAVSQADGAVGCC